MSPTSRLAPSDPDDGFARAGEPATGVAERRTGGLDLRGVRRGLRAYGWLGVVFGIALFAGVVTYAETLPAVYQGEAIVSFSPRVEAGSGADEVSLLLPRYDAVIGSQAVLRETARDLNTDVDRVESAVDVRQPADTTNLEIVVTDRDSGFAVEVANRLANEAVRAAGDDELVAATVVSRALPANAPSGPPRRLMEAAGLVVALVGALAIPLAADRLRPRVTRLTDATAALDVPALGDLTPAPAGSEARSAPVPSSRWATRTALLRAAQRTGARSVAMISLSSEAARHAATAAVGDAVAGAGTRALAVDARLATRELSRLFHLTHVPGLAEMLSPRDGQAASNAFITPQRTPSGLEVLPAGPRPDHSATAAPQADGLLARGLAGALERLGTRYELVLVDAPALDVGDEPLIVADAADAAVLLVEPGQSLTALVADKRRVELLGAPVLGIIGVGFTPPPRRERRWGRHRRSARAGPRRWR